MPAAHFAPDVRRTYVLDTSVLLSDPRALTRFAEHDVVIPVVVVTELEAKRSHPELGYFARQALRLLDDLRVENGRLDEPMSVGESGGTVRVELNHTDVSVLPSGLRLGDNDTRILAVARNLQADGKAVVLVSKDLPMRVKASSVGLPAEEYRAEFVVETGYTGMTEIDVTVADVDRLYDDQVIDLEAAMRPALPHRARAALRPRQRPRPRDGRTSACDWSAATARRSASTAAAPSSASRSTCCWTPTSASCRWAAGPAPASSALALCAGLEAVLERRQHRKVIVFRPLFAVGGQELGYLPGSEAEKMSPWGQAVFDTLGAVTTQEVVEEIVDRGMLEVLPLTHIRGRSLHDAFVIVDEAQSLERNVLLTVLSRIGRDSRVVLTHDVAQRDNLRVGRHDGVVAVVEKLKGHPLFAHVTLTRSERSPIAALVTEMLEDINL